MFKKRGEKGDRLTIKEAIAKSMELPLNVMEGLPEIELLGNREAVVEHCQGVLEYTDQVVRLNTGKLVVRFLGRDLKLRCMNETGVTVEGFILSIDFS